MSRYNAKVWKLIILGKGGIGKSELVKQYIKPDKHFHSVYDPTIEDVYHVTEMVDNKRYVLEVIDVGGFGQFQDNQDARMRDCDGFILAFAIDDKKSFRELSEIRDQILRVRDTTRVAILLVGTKYDLGNSQREVSTEEARRLALSWGCEYVETSARTQYNVGEAFSKLIATIVQLQTADNKRPSPFLCCFGSSVSRAH